MAYVPTEKVDSLLFCARWISYQLIHRGPRLDGSWAVRRESFFSSRTPTVENEFLLRRPTGVDTLECSLNILAILIGPYYTAREGNCVLTRDQGEFRPAER